jgi:predicted MFS family arabinose efflux permease
VKRATFIILCLEGAVLSFNVAATAALIPSIADSFSVAPFFAGKAVWLYMLPYGLAALLYGPLARVFDVKRIELFCLFLFSLSNLAVGLSRDINAVFAGRFFMGIFGASITPLVLILISRITDGKNRGKYVGTFFSMTFIASLLGLFLSGILPWRLIYIIPAISGFLLWIYMYFYLPSFKHEVEGLKINYLDAFKNKAVLHIFIYIFIISLVYHGVQQWLSVYFARKFGFTQFLISILITLTSLSGVFGEVIGGFCSDKLGRFKTMEWGIIMMVAGASLLIFSSNAVVLALVMLVWGLGWTFNHAGLSTMLTDLPKGLLNEAASLNSSVRFLSGGLGTVLGGLLMQKNLNLNFIVFGIALILLAFLARKLVIAK